VSLLLCTVGRYGCEMGVLLDPRWQKLPSRGTFARSGEVHGVPGVMPSTMARGLPLAGRRRVGGGGAGRLLARLSKLLAESVARFSRRAPPFEECLEGGSCSGSGGASSFAPGSSGGAASVEASGAARRLSWTGRQMSERAATTAARRTSASSASRRRRRPTWSALGLARVRVRVRVRVTLVRVRVRVGFGFGLRSG
jgi:hypothetical protein